MPRLNLLGGTYQARSVIADDQMCMNLFPEMNQKDNDVPVTHYPTPGLTLLAPSSTTAGAVEAGLISNPGSEYVNGTYTNVALVGGHGSGLLVNFTIAGGSVENLTIVAGGTLYVDGDILTLPPSFIDGSDFTYNISEVAPGVLPGEARCEYQLSNGQYVRIVGANVYAVNNTWQHKLLGKMQTSTGICYITDNGLVAVIADGTATSYYADMTTGAFGTISPTNFYGASKVDFLDTFLLFNNPGTADWYSSLSNVTSSMLADGTAFDPLYVASKTGSPDFIGNFAVVHLEIWLIGTLTTEIWYDAGTADFPFGRLPGTFVEHGIAAPNSLAKHDLALFWLSQDREGHCEVVMGGDYRATRISTHAVEFAINGYQTITDAIGFCYQQEGHTFYVLTFPSADATWVFDKTSGLWHERGWLDPNGVFHRIRANCCANPYQTVVVGDWQTGALYKLDLNNYTDNGQPVARVRRFKHLIDSEDTKVTHKYFIADMDPGNDISADGTSQNFPPKVSLRWSDDRGKTFSNPVMQSLGATGQYATSIKWNRLGIARDRIYELAWSINAKTSLQGAWLSTAPTGN
jgi:hypothetical protein